MFRYFPILCLLIFLVSGCSSLQGKSKVVIMQHPETMDFKNCDVGKIGLEKDFADKDACVSQHQAMGYIIWGER